MWHLLLENVYGVQSLGTNSNSLAPFYALVEEETKQTTDCEGGYGWTLECGQCKCYFHGKGLFFETISEGEIYLAKQEMMRHLRQIC